MAKGAPRAAQGTPTGRPWACARLWRRAPYVRRARRSETEPKVETRVGEPPLRRRVAPAAPRLVEMSNDGRRQPRRPIVSALSAGSPARLSAQAGLICPLVATRRSMRAVSTITFLARPKRQFWGAGNRQGPPRRRTCREGVQHDLRSRTRQGGSRPDCKSQRPCDALMAVRATHGVSDEIPIEAGPAQHSTPRRWPLDRNRARDSVDSEFFNTIGQEQSFAKGLVSVRLARSQRVAKRSIAFSSHSIPKPGLSGTTIWPFSIRNGSCRMGLAQSCHSSQCAVSLTRIRCAAISG